MVLEAAAEERTIDPAMDGTVEPTSPGRETQVRPGGGIHAPKDRGFWAFCTAEHARLVATLAAILGDRALAEDLSHEALARVWTRWERVRRMERPGAYAHRIAVNLARRHLRRLARERDALTRVSGERVANQPDVATAVTLRAAVAALPPRQRAAVVCRYFADLSVAETARALGCREGTVKALTHQALAALRRSGVTDDDEEGR